MTGKFRISKRNEQRDDERLRTTFEAAVPSLKLEKVFLRQQKYDFYGFIDGVDVSRLTTIYFGNFNIDPRELVKFIRRCAQLRHLEFRFFSCKNTCNQQLQFNKQLT